MNRGNTDMTMAMSEASYPLVYINHEGQYINCLHGYNNEMDVSFMRDTITPLADDRRISLYIDKYNNDITSVAYEVRSLDGERLIEDAEIFNYREQSTGISADIVIKDLIDQDTEYEFVVILGTSSGKSIKYYTRIVQRSENYAGEEIRFALDFHEKTFDKEAARELAKYLETDETGDNTTYSYVNIHNSFVGLCNFLGGMGLLLLKIAKFLLLDCCSLHCIGLRLSCLTLLELSHHRILMLPIPVHNLILILLD
jgi:hypothetical protein